MLTVKDCLDFSELTDEELRVLAEHEHIPEVVAAELGQCLLKSDVGTWLIKRYIREELESAERGRAGERIARLKAVLERFSEAHPTYDLTPRRGA